MSAPFWMFMITIFLFLQQKKSDLVPFSLEVLTVSSHPKLLQDWLSGLVSVAECQAKPSHLHTAWFYAFNHDGFHTVAIEKTKNLKWICTCPYLSWLRPFSPLKKKLINYWWISPAHKNVYNDSCNNFKWIISYRWYCCMHLSWLCNFEVFQLMILVSGIIIKNNNKIYILKTHLKPYNRQFI